MRNFSTTNLLLALASAILISITFLFKQAWFISLFSIVPLLVTIKSCTSSKAFKLGTLTGTTAYFITTYWLIGTITRFGGFPILIAILFHIFISIYSGLIFGIFCYFVVKLHFQDITYLKTILLGFIWLSIEYYYPLLFPFTIASPLANYYPLIQVSDLVGINFYSFILILFNFAIYNIVQSLRLRQKFRYREIIVLFVVTTTFLAYGVNRISKVDKDIEKTNKIKVGIVQGNFDFTEKTKNNYLYMTNEYKRLSSKLNSNPDLIIWPETSIQVFIPTDSHFLEFEGDILIPQKTSSYFLTGGLSYEIVDKYDVFDDENINHYNSAFLTDSNGKILGRFHKIKLLLFGEYLPFSEYIPSIKKLSPATGDYVPGTDLNILNIEKYKLNIATLICYEDIIPSFARKFKEKGANLLVNLTNDAWFGKTIAPYQHLLLSLPRAVENRTYLIRATNTGVSAIIDPVGRTQRETELFKKQTLESNVGIMDNGPTFYVKYGYRIYPLCLILSIFYIGFITITKKKESLKAL